MMLMLSKDIELYSSSDLSVAIEPSKVDKRDGTIATLKINPRLTSMTVQLQH